MVMVMEGWVDVHCHILPGVDDGPPSEDASAQLVQGLCQLGFGAFVATPHVRVPRWNPSIADIQAARQRLLPLLPPELTIEVAAENFFDDSAWRRFEAGELITYPGGRAVLVEFAADLNGIPFGVENRFFDLEVAGLRPVLAHPERQAKLMKDRASLERVVGQDRTLLLVSLTSLGKRDGGTVRRAATRLITSEFPVAVASDAHRVEDLRYVERGLKRLRKLVGDEGMTEMLINTPQTLLNGRP
jgi:protein-tyrosine phosphatase